VIIARSPFRISLGGGGTDLPSYYREHEGFVVAAAIDRYVYIMLHHRFVRPIFLKYSKLELADRVEDIEHPIIREALKLTGVREHLELASMADIPSGTGLGSSGSFTTSLLKALYTYQRRAVLAQELAEQACDIEINRLGEPVGKQDQYIAAFGGLTCFTFHRDDTVTAEPLRIDQETLYNLEDNLLLYFTGYSRSAGSILKDQDARTRRSDSSVVDNLHYVKEMGLRSRALLEKGDLVGFGELMNEHWERKKERASSMSNPDIDRWYARALENGAVGGKLVGAGGGGFLMHYAADKIRLRQAMRAEGLQEVRFRFDFEGAKVLAS
jgi:D-glycero-alpha-D-manno-heptose-7-phosphate kinase